MPAFDLSTAVLLVAVVVLLAAIYGVSFYLADYTAERFVPYVPYAEEPTMAVRIGQQIRRYRHLLAAVIISLAWINPDWPWWMHFVPMLPILASLPMVLAEHRAGLTRAVRSPGDKVVGIAVIFGLAYYLFAPLLGRFGQHDIELLYLVTASFLPTLAAVEA